MASYEGRRSFLFGMTLNELAFMMFFLLMLLSTSALHDKEVLLDRQEEQNRALEQEIARTRDDLDASFKRLELLEKLVGGITGLAPGTDRALLEQTFEKLKSVDDVGKLAADNARLRQQLARMQPLSEQLQKFAPDQKPEQALKTLLEQHSDARKEQDNLRGRLHFLQKQLQGNGLDHPPCWADPETGAIQYLYRITIREQGLGIEGIWPDSRNQDAASLPGAEALAGTALTLDRFAARTGPLFQWSKTHECRHFVRIRDDPNTSKRTFKTALLTIESVFYKYLEH